MLQRDFEHLQICSYRYPNVFVLTAREGTEEEGYTETTKCDRDRLIIYLPVLGGKVSFKQYMKINTAGLLNFTKWVSRVVMFTRSFFRSALILILCLSITR